jgi:hypothetical protein
MRRHRLLAENGHENELFVALNICHKAHAEIDRIGELLRVTTKVRPWRDVCFGSSSA